MKKMPRSVYLSLFLLIVGVIAGGILAGVNMLTAPIIEDNKRKELEKTFAEIGVTIGKLEKFDLLENVSGVYPATYEGKEVLVIVSQNKNKYTTVELVSVFDKTNGSLLNGKVSGVPSITTHAYDAKFTNENLGLIGATSGADLNKISGATISTDSVRVCLDTAIAQFIAVVGSVEKPTTVKCNSTAQNVEADILNEFTANLTINSAELTNQVVNVVFTYDFTTKTPTFVSSDFELDEELKALCMSEIKAPTTYITAVVEENNQSTFTVISNLTFESVFTTTITVSEDGTIESYNVVTDNGFTVQWDDRTADINAFIGSVPGTNVSGVDSLSYVSGATHTTNALKEPLLLVKAYVELGGAE